MKELGKQELRKVVGGNEGVDGSWKEVRATIASGFLALRSAPCYDDGNIIAELQNGEHFKVCDSRWNGCYIWACAHGREGWVHGDYIIWC